MIYRSLSEIDKKYNIIYADPPWKYHVMDATPYQTMELGDISSLPIQKILDKNCYLFMWVTMPCIPEGLELIKSWGFEYKTTAFVWVKRTMQGNAWFLGQGYYTRSNTELCFLATKGHLNVISHGVRQIIESRIGEGHSVKPHGVRDRIVDLLGDIPRIELFARQSIPGWDCWSIDDVQFGL